MVQDGERRIDHPGSPGARLTGVSVAALSSPARTGRAMWHRRVPKLASPSPPKKTRVDDLLLAPHPPPPPPSSNPQTAQKASPGQRSQ